MILRLAGLAGALLLTGSAHAITAGFADLVLGFRATGGQGSGLNLEVNLGQPSLYAGLAPNTSFVVTQLNSLDLVSTYGAAWDDNTTLSFGIVGAVGSADFNGYPARTLWASRPEATPGTPVTPWNAGSADGQQNAGGRITTMYSGAPGSLSNGSPTANSLDSTVIANNLGGSWTVQENGSAGQSFSRWTPRVRALFSSFPTIPAIYDGTNPYLVVELFELRPDSGAGTRLGAFGLNPNGQLVFSNNPSVFAPIPEPATALTFAFSGLALVARRRRSATA